MYPVISFALSAMVLAAMVISLVLRPATSKRISSIFMLIAVIGGLLFYGIGYAEVLGDPLLCVIRTPMSVIRMFIGVNDLDTIRRTSLVSGRTGLVLFWLVHLMAFYSMASAAMFTLGAAALRQMRFLLAKHGDLTLIYGVNERSTALGRECLAAGNSSVVFIAENADESTVSELNTAGMSILTGRAAVRSERSAIRKLRIRRRKLTVYAMDEQEDRNLSYALLLKDALEAADIPAKDTQIALAGAADIVTPMLQATDTAYGFGYVNVFNSPDLAARAMIHICPPWEFMHFDAEGHAEENFDCVVAGFGKHGQAVLKMLVMNGQFSGSRFHAAVFSPNIGNEAGFLEYDSPEIFRQYDIERYAADARSSVFYNYILSRIQTLKIIAVCTGDEDMNREVSDNLMLFLQRHHAERICVVRCGKEGARYQESVGSPIVRSDSLSLNLLSARKADRLAILLNSTYDASERSDWEKWMDCDSFGKLSSRASADFYPAFLRISGSSREEVLRGDWHPDEAMQQVLGETEHLRWCAFHYVMGYAPMTDAEFEANAAAYLRRKAEGKPADSKIGKDRDARKHACLIPWEELDALSARESAVTGRKVNYKQTDINNVLALPGLLRAEQEDSV